MVADGTDIDTLECRLSSKLYRGEAGDPKGNGSDNPLDKAVLSLREEVGFAENSELSDTHNSAEVS